MTVAKWLGGYAAMWITFTVASESASIAPLATAFAVLIAAATTAYYWPQLADNLKGIM